MELDPPPAWRSGAPDSYDSATVVRQVDGNGQVIGGPVPLRGLPRHIHAAAAPRTPTAHASLSIRPPLRGGGSGRPFCVWA